MYYEELSVGQTFTSPARTVTETDPVSFAMLSGDWNPIHIDKEFAQRNLLNGTIVLEDMIIRGENI